MPDWSSGGRTPSGPAAGGRTPAWGAASSRSKSSCTHASDLVPTAVAPAWSGGASSARTPMWRSDGMAGSRTPAYGGADGGRTVNPYAAGGSTAYGGSGGVSYLSLFLTCTLCQPSQFRLTYPFSTANASLGPWLPHLVRRCQHNPRCLLPRFQNPLLRLRLRRLWLQDSSVQSRLLTHTRLQLHLVVLE